MTWANEIPGIRRDSKVGREVAFDKGYDQSEALVLFEDFLGPSGAAPAVHVDDDVLNSATAALNGAAGGAVALTFTAAAEAQAARVDIGPFNLSQIKRVRWRQTLTPAGATYPANMKYVAGLATKLAAAEDDLDAETINLWFGMFAASLNIVFEHDDNTTNKDDLKVYTTSDTQEAYVKGTAQTFEIDLSLGTDRVRLKIDDEFVTADAAGAPTKAGSIVEIDMSNADAQDVYWVADLQRSSGTGAAADVAAVDWVEIVYVADA